MTDALLAGRVALLTGVGSGLGRGLATAFAAAGARVALVARSRGVSDALAADIREAGGEAIVLTGDIGDDGSVERAVAATTDRFGTIDIAVQIAAHPRSNLPLDLSAVTDAEWSAQGDVTLTGCFRLARAVHPALKASGRGRFMAITSAYGLSGDGGNPIYSAQKGALRGMAKSLAKEWGPDGITVNLFAPSSESEATNAYFARFPEAWEGFRKAFPLGRMGRPVSDIAPAVVALAGDQFGFVTGQTIPIDGGFYTTL